MPADRNIPELVEPIQRIRAVAILPAAPAWETSAWFPCAGFHWLSLYIHYQQGLAGGAVSFYLLFRPGPITPGAALGSFQMSAYAVGPVVAGADTASLLQREMVTYTSTAAAAEGSIFGPIAIRGTAEYFALACTETGVPGTPGNLGIDVQMAV